MIKEILFDHILIRYRDCSCSSVAGIHFNTLSLQLGWTGGAMVLGKLPVPGCPTNLDDRRAWDCCACSRCGGVFFDIFTHLSFLTSFSLSLGDGPI